MYASDDLSKLTKKAVQAEKKDKKPQPMKKNSEKKPLPEGDKVFLIGTSRTIVW